jgi:endonuclease III
MAVRTRKHAISKTKALTRTSQARGRKRRFNIATALDRIRTAVAPFSKAALFDLAAQGYTSAFEQVVACIISIRTRDEVTVPTALNLFAVARTAHGLAKLRPAHIDRLIHNCSFHGAKAKQIHAIARRVVDEFDGDLPCEEETLLSFSGVGPKCANLVLGIACGQPRVGVDIHVHRVTNRWGYIAAPTPERTMLLLHEKLPRQFWIELNSLLVPFGKHICTGQRPKCSTCPVLDMCRQIGVTSHS